MFSADIQEDLQRAVFTLPKTGKNRKGGDVPLEDQRIETLNTADADKVVIEPAGGANALEIAVRASDTFAIPEGETSVIIDLVAKCDGSFGEGVTELVEPGAIVIRHGAAAGFTVEAKTEEIA